jgi:aminopeptidase N
MKQLLIAGVGLFYGMVASAQPINDWKTFYRATPEKQLSMVHTKLDVSFDYNTRRMNGKAWLTMSPHFYPTDSALLDAKGMWIHEVSLVEGSRKTPLAYSYADSLTLRIKLNRVIQRGEKVILYIAYTARPDELSTRGSAAITSAKGLYFINPDGKDSTKPTQIWTQGETEATSVWCPTVDKPNQKTTQEISMTVPDKYVTLSNGVLVKQVKNGDGTRTDTWKMDLPHAPYLMFMGVGDFAIIRDKYKQIPVDYYVEKAYAPVARRIYGDTPEMIAYFSKLLGVEYAWPKYAQMVGRDFVSGAMENTTATLHGAWANQNARQLTDGNSWETVVAHELFHHWFGNLVTTESWSNLTVNESFADYSEYLWTEYKHGRDAADEYHLNAMLGYLNNPGDHGKHLVRFFYRDKEDMFDQVSYQKGGRILHMLRYELGDSAFFKGLNLYLTQNRFKAAEAHQVRLALEEVTGKDLNPFFNQWFFNSGHPDVKITYGSADGKVFVALEQMQKDRVFQLPLTIAQYAAEGKPALHKVVFDKKIDTFYFPQQGGAIYLEADADRVMLWKKTETKTAEAWAAQYYRMSNFISRLEALAGLKDTDTADKWLPEVMRKALTDPYHGIRSRALRYFARYPEKLGGNADWAVVEQMALNEKNRPTRAAAIDALAKRKGGNYLNLFEAATTDSSYTVAGAALEALTENNLPKAQQLKSKLAEDAEGRLAAALDILAIAGAPLEETEAQIAAYKKKNGIERLGAAKGMVLLAGRQTTAAALKQVMTPVVEMYKRVPAGFGTYKEDLRNLIEGLLDQKLAAVKANPADAELPQMVKYLEAQL